jgi:hypothetical protein
MAGAIRRATDLQLNDKFDLRVFERSRNPKMPGACSVRA